jgi:hypothetical protein
MAHIKKYSRFVEEFVMTGTETKPAPTTTPAPTTVPRPRTRPGIAPTEVPSEEDAPLAKGTETKPAPTTTPAPTTVPRPRTRPGIAPTEVPSEEDAPLAVAKKVMDRLEDVYRESSKSEKEEIDSHFEK